MNHTARQPTAKALIVIPARFSSTRLPGKPLMEIEGRAMVLHTLDRALAARNVSRAIVATDDVRIRDLVERAGHEAVMTRGDHKSGTDRVAQVAQALEGFEIIVNLQGDEPLIDPQTIELVIDALATDEETMMATTSERISDKADVLSPDVVKVVADERGQALYFSRSPIPYPRDAVRRHGSLEAALERDETLLGSFRKHTGLYAYRRDFLLRYARWPPSRLEQTEALEQLRVLANGVKIRVIESPVPSIGVDTMDDLERVRKIIEVRGQR